MERNWQFQTDGQSTVTEDVISDRRLWTAVLVSAVEDWRNGSLRMRRKAQEFLFDSTADFQLVCARAGVDPISFRAKLLKIGNIIETHGTLLPLVPPVAA